MENLPPKALKTKLVRLDNNLRNIERSQIAGIQRAQGSLPVLQAFQEFLDKERKAARRRLMIVTALCIFLILLVSVGAGTFIYMNREKMKVDYSKVAKQANTLESELKNKSKATKSQLEALEAYIKNNSDKQNELLQEQTNVISKTTHAQEQISEMQISLNNLKTKNKLLKTQLDKIVNNWQTLGSNSVASNVKSDTVSNEKETAPLTAQKDQTKVATQEKPELPKITKQPPAEETKAEHNGKTMLENKPKTVANKSEEHTASINLTIIPEGEKQGIRWRLPRIAR